jgi:hypothetical protein
MITKIKLKVPTFKQRNPYVAPSLFRKAGAHDKFSSAKRQKDRRELQQQLLGRKIKEFDS